MSLPRDSDSATDEDDCLLSFRPFSPRNCREVNGNRDQEERTTKENEVEGDSGSVADDIDEAVARRRADSCDVPKSITSPCQLVWYQRQRHSIIQYYPCRVCEPREQTFELDSPHHGDRSKKVLVQFIKYPAFGERTLVSRDALVSYYGGYYGERSTAVEGRCWSKKIWGTYRNQREKDLNRKGKRWGRTESMAEMFFLEKVLKISWERKRSRDDGVLKNSVGTDSEDHDDDDMCEDMDEPYTQDLRLGSDDEEMGFQVESLSNEPIRPGDVLEYYSHVFVSGDKRGLRNASVLSVDPRRDPVLVLDNGDFLPSDTQVRRIRTIMGGKLQDHPGIYRAIDKFKLCKMVPEGTGVAAGIRKESERLGKVIQKNVVRFQAAAEANGFAPMDMLHNYKCAPERVGKKKERPQKAAARLPQSTHMPAEPTKNHKDVRHAGKKNKMKKHSSPPRSSSEEDNDFVKNTRGRCAEKIEKKSILRKCSPLPGSSSSSGDDSVHPEKDEQHDREFSTPSNGIINSLKISSQSSSLESDMDNTHITSNEQHSRRSKVMSSTFKKVRSGTKSGLSPKRKSPHASSAVKPVKPSLDKKKSDSGHHPAVCLSDSSASDTCFVRPKQRKIATQAAKGCTPKPAVVRKGHRKTYSMETPKPLASSGLSYDSSTDDDFACTKQRRIVVSLKSPTSRQGSRSPGPRRNSPKNAVLKKPTLSTFTITRKR